MTGTSTESETSIPLLLSLCMHCVGLPMAKKESQTQAPFRKWYLWVPQENRGEGGGVQRKKVGILLLFIIIDVEF